MSQFTPRTISRVGVGNGVRTLARERAEGIDCAESPSLVTYVCHINAYGVSPQVLASVLRICTHPGIFKQPSTRAETMVFCKALLSRAHPTVIQPGDRHWPIFAELCEATNAAGNLVQDAWFAALAIEHGCEWISTDGDYERFAGLRWRRPFE